MFRDSADSVMTIDEFSTISIIFSDMTDRPFRTNVVYFSDVASICEQVLCLKRMTATCRNSFLTRNDTPF